MNDPALYAEHNDITCDASKFIMDKYGGCLSWKEDEMIMEVGIGDGRNTKKSILPQVKSNFSQYVGVDISKDFLDLAQRTLEEDPRLKFIEMDITTDSLPNIFIRSFDHVLSFLTFHWVNNTRKAYENMYAMLKPGGEIFMMFFARIPTDYGFAELEKHPRWAKYDHNNLISPYFYSKNPLKECEKDLVAAGVKHYRIEEEKNMFRFPNENNFKNLLYSVNPMLKNIPAEEIDDYKRDYVEYTLKKGGYVEGNEHGLKFIECHYKLLFIYAKK